MSTTVPAVATSSDFRRLRLSHRNKINESAQVYLGSTHQAARALGGYACGRNRALVPGPGHSRHDRSLSVTFLSSGILVHSFAGDDPLVCKDHIRAGLGLEPFRPGGAGIVVRPVPAPAQPDRDQAARLERARRLWTESTPLQSTLGWRYLTEIRGLDIDRASRSCLAMAWWGASHNRSRG